MKRSPFGLFVLFLLTIILLSAQSIIASTASASQRKDQDPFAYTTISDYCAFLNAVAKTDLHQLYDEKMGVDAIVRTGEPGYYGYSLIAKNDKIPISYLSWTSAARFCNWRENGSLSYETNANITENGIYELQEEQLVSVLFDKKGSCFPALKEDASEIKKVLPKGCHMNYWGAPAVTDSFSKPLFSVSLNDSSINQTDGDPCLKSNKTGLIIGDSAAHSDNAPSDSSYDWWSIEELVLPTLALAGGGYCCYHSFKSNQLFQKANDRLSGEKYAEINQLEELHERLATPQQGPANLKLWDEDAAKKTKEARAQFLAAFGLPHDVDYQKQTAKENYAFFSKKADEIKKQIRRVRGVNLNSEKTDKIVYSLGVILGYIQGIAISYEKMRNNPSFWSDALTEHENVNFNSDSFSDISYLDINTARTSLDLLFQKAPTTYFQAVHEEFNERFDTDNTKEIALESLQEFINEKRVNEPSSWNPYNWQLFNPYRNACLWQAGTAAFSALKNQRVFTDHINPLESIGLSYVVTLVGDWTSSWRQVPLHNEATSIARSSDSALDSVNSAEGHDEATSIARSSEDTSTPNPTSTWNCCPLALSSLGWASLWNFVTTSLSVCRNYPESYIHQHVPVFLGLSWSVDCINDLTRGWRQMKPANHTVTHEASTPATPEGDRQSDQETVQEAVGENINQEFPALSQREGSPLNGQEAFYSALRDASHDMILDVENDQIVFKGRSEAAKPEPSYQAALAQIRSYIESKFGQHAAIRFKNEFNVIEQLDVPLTVGQLRDFIQSEERNKYHIFAPGSSLKALLGHIEHKGDHVIIANSSFQDGSASEESERLAGMIQVKNSIETYFKNLNLQPYHQRDILASFNKRFMEPEKRGWIFVEAQKKQELTIENVRSFIQRHEEQSKDCWNTLYYDCISNPYLCTALWSAFATSCTAIRVYYLPHQFLLSTGLVFVVNFSGDLCGRYRQLPVNR